MGDFLQLQSTMAGSSLVHNHSSSLGGWDLHNHHSLGVFNTDMSSNSMEDGTPSPIFFSSLDSDLSTGYLQDALVKFRDRSKRRRLLLYAEDQSKSFNYPAKSYWDSNRTWDLYENFNSYSHTTSIDNISDGPISTWESRINEEEASIFTEIKTPEETSAQEAVDSSSPFKLESLNYHPKSINHTPPSVVGGENDGKRKKRGIFSSRMVYPFGVVKPGGVVEGEVTLNEINERIQMPPSRPVKHPVGDFACRPCVSANGPGLSGKAVVALTRIHTQGRGTITIIRTKG